MENKRIKLFENFDEVNENVIDKFENVLEDWAQSDFVKKITGKDELGYTDDYDLDSDEESAWVEVFDVKPEYIKELEDNYDKFAKDFDTWAKSQKFVCETDILTSEDNKNISFTLRKPNFRR